MKKKVFVALLVVLISIIFISNYSFAGWTQPKGTAYTQLSYNYFVSEEKFTTIHRDEDTGIIEKIDDDDIELTESSKFVSQNITFYGQYGITDKMHASVTIPYMWIDSGNVEEFNDESGPRGVGDINVGLRYKIMNNLLGGPLSVEGVVKIPEAYEYGDPLTEMSLGKGQYDLYLGISFGRGLGKGYGVFGAGYNYKFENSEYYAFKPSDEIKISIDGGYPVPFIKKVSIRGRIAYAYSMENASVSDDMLSAAAAAGQPVKAKFGEEALIKDALGLEASSLDVGGSLVLNLPVQVVFSYTTTVEGFWGIRTKDSGKGTTYSIAAVKSF